MMHFERQFVEELKKRFDGYLLTFTGGPVNLLQNIELKKQHTYQVCREILTLAGQLQLSVHEQRLAESIALFHDIGRFEQYAKYGTYVDALSVDHAKLGIKIMRKHDLLNGIDAPTKRLIYKTIRYHNRAALPVRETAHCLFFTKLLRDADKLDIWRVVTEYYHRKESTRNGAIELDLPDTPGVSAQVVSDILNKRIVAIAHVKNLNDFKLLQIGWIFDINFEPTFRAIRERRYLEKIREVLPASAALQQIFAVIENHIDPKGLYAHESAH